MPVKNSGSRKVRKNAEKRFFSQSDRIGFAAAEFGQNFFQAGETCGGRIPERLSCSADRRRVLHTQNAGTGVVHIAETENRRAARHHVGAFTEGKTRTKINNRLSFGIY